MSILAGEPLVHEQHLRELREADLRMRTEKSRNILALGVGVFEHHRVSGEGAPLLRPQGLMRPEALSQSPALGAREEFSLERGWEGSTMALCHHWAARKIQQLRERTSFVQGFTSNNLIALKNAAETKDCREFARLARTIHWAHYPPSELTQAIDLALALDMVQVARELAQEGHQLFPRDARIQRAVGVLSPAFFIRTRPSEETDFESSQRWLKDHASQYRGRWVAVHAGTLLGSAPSLKELHQQIGPQGRTPKTIIVKVLS